MIAEIAIAPPRKMLSKVPLTRFTEDGPKERNDPASFVSGQEEGEMPG